MKRYLLAPFLLTALAVFGQQNVAFEKKNFEDNLAGYKKAMDSMKAGDAILYNKKISDNYLAIPYYMTAEKLNPNNAKLNYEIGICMLSHNSPFKTGALEYLQKAYALDSNVAPDIHYYLGRGYHLNMDWEDAKKEYNTYLDMRKVKKSAEEIADTKKKIEECDNGEILMQHPVKVIIENLGPEINTKYPEYGVLVNDDETELIFTSKRPNTMGNGMDRGSSQYMEDIYISHFVNGAWTPATNSGTSLNTDNNDATAGMSLDGKTLYIYRGSHGGDLYSTQLIGDTAWSNPVLLSDKINSKYFETSVCVTPDGKTIYFVSQRPGGYGGRDIYRISTDSDGTYGTAENIGPVINTQYDEEGVALSPDGKTLYFSSEGHNTMGGYDVFKSYYENGQWAAPINMGYPINTPDDDVFYCVSANGKHAYYSSIRKGGEGEKDIYRITFLKSDTTIPVKVADISSSRHTKAKQLNNEANVEPTNETNEELNNKAKEFNSDSLAHTAINVGTNIVLHNIFFNFNKATLRNESRKELNKLVAILNAHPNIKIQISGYTDSRGSASYNLKLSEARAKSVVDYLVKHGIDASRLTYKGYGKKNPIASNKTKQGRQLNRRTEFKVIG